VTIPATTLAVSGDRFAATYDLIGDPGEARARAEAICVEQTIEFPADLIADDDIRRHVIGRIEALDVVGPARVRAHISYAVETSAFQLPQLLTVLFGNCSLLPRVRLVGFELPPSMLGHFRGPRYGSEGLRERLGITDRPLMATALKPMGLGATQLAAMAGVLATAGIDLIKDDQGLADQPWARFEDRVRACAAAVHEANDRTGGRAVYLPVLNGPTEELVARAQAAKEAGAGGFLILPGLIGFDAMRALADDDLIGLPIMAHPGFLGSFVSSEDAGIEHGVVLGALMRLAGADLSIFPSYGGRFSFSRDACASIAEACRQPMGLVRPCLPAPGGGMTLPRIGELLDFYGNDVALLIGGDLHRGDLLDNARRMREAVERLSTAQPAAIAGG
jgi:ribulose-bisphosphate carboxylase large chain